jgi:hypothetical protein
MIRFEVKGSFKKTEAYLRKLSNLEILSILDAAGREGVAALSSETPVESGLASYSWGYKVEHKGRGYSVIWTNSDVENGFPVVIMLQYGYSTGTGGYVQGRDYINPALRPVFKNLANRVRKAVKSAA